MVDMLTNNKYVESLLKGIHSSMYFNTDKVVALRYLVQKGGYTSVTMHNQELYLQNLDKNMENSYWSTIILDKKHGVEPDFVSLANDMINDILEQRGECA